MPDWLNYANANFYDELITPAGNSRAAARNVVKMLRELSKDELAQRQSAAELTIKDMGISFTVYSESGNIDRSWLFYIIPRVISAKEWRSVALGLKQRSRALKFCGRCTTSVRH
jgi:uncharacterized circularly permuted ATP-grasp superfamily protein